MLPLIYLPKIETSDIIARLRNHHISQLDVPLRFRKAEMLLFGSARETRRATCQNRVIVSKTKKSLRSPFFSTFLWYIIFSTLTFLKMILNKKESLKIMKTGSRAALPFLVFN